MANKKPFIIAEMSGNHNQSLERALGMIDAVVAIICRKKKGFI